MTRYSSEPRKTILPDQGQINEIEYFQSMYPQNMKILQKYVIEECDRMDYKGSPIYDEYPDAQMIRQACGRICANIPEAEEEQANADIIGTGQVEISEIGKGQTEVSQQLMRWNSGSGRPPQGPPPGPWGPPPGRPPQGPPPGPWGPPPGRPPQGPPPGPWGPPPGRPPQGPPPGPWGPPPGRPPQGPPPGRPPQGPPPGPWGPPPGRPPQGPPPGPWGPPPGRPPQGPPHGPWMPGSGRKSGWLQDIVQVLLTNEIQNRRCRTGRC